MRTCSICKKPITTIPWCTRTSFHEWIFCFRCEKGQNWLIQPRRWLLWAELLFDKIKSLKSRFKPEKRIRSLTFIGSEAGAGRNMHQTVVEKQIRKSFGYGQKGDKMVRDHRKKHAENMKKTKQV